MSRRRQIITAALIAAGALVYGISPIDIVPEFLAGPLGLSDDIVVMISAALGIWNVLRPSRVPGQGQAGSAPQPGPQQH